MNSTNLPYFPGMWLISTSMLSNSFEDPIQFAFFWLNRDYKIFTQIGWCRVWGIGFGADFSHMINDAKDRSGLYSFFYLTQLSYFCFAL